MADNNTTPADAPVDTTPPWEQVWNKGVDAAKTFMNDTASTIDNAVGGDTNVNPWQMNFSATARPNDPTVAPAQPDPPDFGTVFKRLLGVESGGNQTNPDGSLVTSPKGAQGISQVMPKTGANPGYGVTPLQDNSKEEYMRFGSDYLKAMLNNFGGDYQKALAAYNAGAGTIEKAITKAQKLGGDWKQYLPNGVAKETIPYVSKILGQ